MVISGLAKSTLVDFPGVVACVLFVPGCNYNCFYCHNRTLIDGTHEVLSPESVDAFLKKRVDMLEGVVISGGEPTLQQDLLSYSERIKSLGFKLKLDTNGASPETVETLLKAGVVDYFAVDYKAPSARYAEICGGGADAGAVLETINLILGSGAKFEVRTTVVPQLGEGDMIQMAEELPVLPRYVLNRYKEPEKYLPSDKERVEKTPYTPSQIAAFAQLIRPLQPNVTL